MKSKKAIKRLTRVEKLLSEVQSHYSAIEKPLGKLLSSAKASVEGIKDAIAKSVSAKAALAKTAKSKKAGGKGKQGKSAHGKKKATAAKAKTDGKVGSALSKKRPAKRAASAKRKPAAAVRRPAVQATGPGASVISVAS